MHNIKALNVSRSYVSFYWGQAVAQFVEALRYKPEGRGFDSRCCHSGRTMALGFNQPLTEMSTGNSPWRVKVVGA